MTDLVWIVVRTAAACAVWGAFLLSAYRIVIHFFPRITLLEKTVGIWLVGHLLASTLVHLWLATGPARSVLAGVLTAGAWVFLYRQRALLRRALARDGRWLARALPLATRTPFRTAFTVLVGTWFLAVSIRALYLPPLAWDSLTYHYVKPVLWMTTGALDPLQAGGGWSFYSLFPPAWETVLFWTLWPAGTDAFLPLADIAAWGALGAALSLLTRRLGIKGPMRTGVVVLVLSLPCIWKAVGSGYTETGFLATFLGAVYWALRRNTLCSPAAAGLAAAGLGLAAGYKIFNLPFIALAGIGLALLALQQRPQPLRHLLFVGGGFAITYVPWLIYTGLLSGYPFSPMDLEIGGLRLGVSTPMVDWYLDRPSTGVYQVAPEWAALQALFLPAWKPTVSFGTATIFMVPFGIAGWWGLRKKASSKRLLLFLGVVATLNAALYFSPAFGMNRLTWATSNARFLLLAILPLLMGVGAFSDKGKWPFAVLCGVILSNAVPFIGYGWARIEWILLPAALVIFVIGAGFLRVLLRHQAAGAGAILLLVLVLVLVSTHTVKGVLRNKLLAEASLLHPIQTYWLPAMLTLQDEPGTVIACTSPPHQNGDNQMWYYLFGRHFQHQLVALPDGAPLPGNAAYHLGFFPGEPARTPPPGWVSVHQGDRPPWWLEKRHHPPAGTPTPE